MPVLIGWSWVAAAVLCVSIAAHVSTFLGIDPIAECPGVMFIHLAIFPPFIAAVLISDFCDLLSGAVAERSVGRRRRRASDAGGIGSANADMSSVNAGEKPARRKSKGSCARLIRAGLAGPLRRGRRP